MPKKDMSPPSRAMYNVTSLNGAKAQRADAFIQTIYRAMPWQPYGRGVVGARYCSGSSTYKETQQGQAVLKLTFYGQVYLCDSLKRCM